jgi:putative ABC transport system ATP-binding protein
MSIESGEFASVVGPSGSGKTTLLAIAGTLERPTTGRVVISGTPVDQLGDKELSAVRAHDIGFVFQQFHLVPALSALDNVTHGLLYRGLPADERRRAAREALGRVGLSHRVSHRPSELSGGECQRVAIARALVGQPRIILADEPTGSVDSAQGADVMCLLADLNRQGSTILVVTHNQAIVRQLGRTIHLRDGRIEDDSGAHR